jgi:iron complex transport system permease protein
MTEALPPGKAPDMRLQATQRKRVQWSLLVLLILLAIASLAIGRSGLGAASILKGVTDPASLERVILLEIRLPRTLLGPLVGFALGLAGAALQALFRNPLAEPSVLGAPQLAALAAVGAIFVGGVPTLSPILPLVAITGALASVGLVALLAGPRATTAVFLLVGLALSSLASALLSLVLALSPNPFALSEIVFWLIGSLEDRSWAHVLLAAFPVLLGVLLILPMRRALGAMVLGEDAALSLGFSLIRLRWIIALGTALMIGGTVAVAGAIGFIGLMAPHLARRWAGPNPAQALFASGLCGATLVLAADILARLVPAQSEIKVGMVTAILGVPVFLLLLLRWGGRLNEGSS